MSRYQLRRSRKPAGPRISLAADIGSASLSAAASGADKPAKRRISTWSRRAQFAHVSAGRDRSRRARSATGVDERRRMLRVAGAPDRAAASAADGVGRDLHERIVPRQAGRYRAASYNRHGVRISGSCSGHRSQRAASEPHGVEQAVDRPPRRLVGALHRGEVGVGAHVVRGEKEVRNGRSSLRDATPMCRRG